MSTHNNNNTAKISGSFLNNQHTQSQHTQAPNVPQLLAQPHLSSTPNSILPLAVKPVLQISGSQQTLQQNQQPIPPRYNQPPQPGGVLKPHLINSTKSHVPNFNYPSEFDSNHLKLNYPPEVPKSVPNLYYPEQFKSSLPISHSQQQYSSIHPSHIRLPPSAVQHHPPPPLPPQSQAVSTGHRLTPAEELLASRLTSSHLQKASQQSSDMLKFVRKADSDTSTTTSSNSGRLSVEQPTKQYVQVIDCLSFNYVKALIL